MEGEQDLLSRNRSIIFAALSAAGALSSFAIYSQPANAKQMDSAPLVSNKQVPPETKSITDTTSCPSPATPKLLNVDDSGLPTFTVEVSM
jgi:hypothetical protein